MQKWLVELGLPNYSRLWGALVLLCGLIVLVSCILFGLVHALILCILFALVYSIACFICFHPDGKYLRDKIDGYYESLFIRTLGYVHRTSSKPQQEIPLKSSEKATEKVQASKACHREAQKIIQLIMRDFIHSWYGNVTTDLEFPDDVQKLLEHVALETNIRMQKIDLEEVITEITTLVIPYLEAVNKSGTRKYNDIEVFDVNSETCLRAFECDDVVSHRALNSRELELKYYRQALDALIQCAFPDKYQNCDLACTFVRELLLKNIIEPLFDLLCDPDFLISSIPLILKKASPEKVQRESVEIKQENEELERKLSHGRLILKIKGSPLSQRRRFQTQSGRFYGSDHYSLTPAPEVPRGSPLIPRKSDKQRAASLANLKRSTWAFSSESFETPLAQSMASHNVGSPQLGVEPEAFTASTYGMLNGNSPPKEGASMSYRSSTLTPSWNDRAEANERRSSEGDDSAWDVVEYERGPIYFDRHVRVVSGSGSSSHVAYIFKFPLRLLSEEELEGLGISDGDTHLEGMKRYSQFDKFHSSLLKTPMATHLKGIALPSKLSFSKMFSKFSLTTNDPDPMELQERIQGLESYLQAISAVLNIANSSQFHDFLITGIKSLKQANIVKPQPKAAKRKSFLSLRKGPHLPSFKEAKKAERIPKRPVETVLSAYLDTNLPLPSHSLHTLHSLKTNGSQSNQPALDPTTNGSQSNQPALDPTTSLFRNGVGTESTTQNLQAESNESLTQDRRATIVNENAGNDSPLQIRKATLTNRTSTNSSPTHYRRATMMSTASTDSPPIHSRRSSLGNDYAVIGTPTNSSVASSGASSEARYIPLADLAATPKAPGYIHHSPLKHKPKRGIPLLDGRGSCNPDTDTDQSSIASYGWNMTMEDEELVTVGSTTSLSTTSFVSAYEPEMEELKIEAKLQVKEAISPAIVDPQIQDPPRLSKFNFLKARLSNFLYSFIFYITSIYNMVLKGSAPVTHEVSTSLAQEHTQRIPLSNAILVLGSEASRRHCHELWACHANTQLALLVLVGGGMERYMWKEFKEVANSSDNWSRVLYHLRHTLWPHGKFMSGATSQSPTEERRKEMRREAVAVIKQFLPNFLPAIVGSSDYDNAVNHVLDCLQNPKATRYFVLRIIDVMLTKLIPELDNKDFQKQLAQLRTLNPPPRNRFSVVRPT